MLLVSFLVGHLRYASDRDVSGESMFFVIACVFIPVMGRGGG
jgi:hypothetical protein